MGIHDGRNHPAVIALLGCSGAGDAEAMLTGECADITEAAARELCLAAADRCEEIPAGINRDECHFRRAEKRGDIAACAQAGSFVEQCRMHVFSAGFATWSAEATVGRDEPAVAARIAEAGFAADDPRPWSAWYRHALDRRRPIDRAACRAVPDEMRREACLHTGVALYQDLLNMARDRHLYPCDGGPLPPLLQTTPDPELDAVRAARSDLCSR